MATLESLVGGWTVYQPLTTEDLQVFRDALKGFVGVNYEPLEVSTQLVNGTNYRYKCNSSIPPADVIWQSIVEIYKPINGEPHIVSIVRL